MVDRSTSGIGQGIAEALAAEGASIMLNGWRPPQDRGKSGCRSSQRFGVSGYSGATSAKARDRRDGREKPEVAGNRWIFGQNAGIQFPASVEESLRQWDQIIASTCRGGFTAEGGHSRDERRTGWGRSSNIARRMAWVASRSRSLCHREAWRSWNDKRSRDRNSRTKE